MNSFFVLGIVYVNSDYINCLQQKAAVTVIGLSCNEEKIMSPDITTANESATSSGESGRCWHRHGACQSRGKWSCFNIFAMVIGFVVFWPMGLVLLFWILSGRNVRDLPEAIQEKWRGFNSKQTGIKHGSSDNVVFDEYQQTQWDRIREIKSEIHERDKRFDDFRADAKRRADEQEFREFMDSQPEANNNKDP